MSEKQEGTVAAIERAIDILEYIRAQGGECTLTGIAKGLDMYKSSVHRVLTTLRNRDYVSQDPVSDRYSLGPRLFILGSMVGENMSFVKSLRPAARQICTQYGECVHITVPYFEQVDLPRQLLVAKIQNPSGVLVVSPPVGSVTYCHSSASGKCMLAFSDAEFLNRFRGKPLPRLTDMTITEWDRLDQQLTQIRQLGYAREDGETEAGLSCAGVPCLDAQGKLWGVISISGPTSRIQGLDIDGVVSSLRAAARSAIFDI